MTEEEKKSQQRQMVQSQNMQQSQQQQQQQQHHMQNSSQQVPIMKDGSSSQELAKWWPVFGRKHSGSSSTFWLKNTKRLTLDDLNSEDIGDDLLKIAKNSDDNEENDENSEEELIKMEAEDSTFSLNLNRISKKTKNSKEYLYALKGNFLVYYKNKNDTHFKGYIKLGQDIIIEKKNLQGKSGDIFYIEFLKDGNVRKLYSKDQQLVNKLFSLIRGKCILQNFRECYKRFELLGQGSFASVIYRHFPIFSHLFHIKKVYKVQRIEDGQFFAAKIIKRGKLEENKYKEKFVVKSFSLFHSSSFSLLFVNTKMMLLNEYNVLCEAKHKNVIKLEEIFQDQDQLVYIMEFLVGGEIYSRLRQIKKFTEEIAAEIMKNLTDGLLHIHNKKIVHRDLKLENILFVNKIDNDCKLIDFGFAEKINYEKLESRAGTPGFLPPELFKVGPYTEKGDIFSLGVILYCLVSGCSPFKGKTYKDVLENNRKCLVSYDQPVWAKISDDCKHLIRRMLEVEPKKRYSGKEILKSKWMQKYYPTSPLQTQKSFNTNKTAKAKRNKFNNDLAKEKGSRDSQELSMSTIINLHNETPKSFYRRSMRSLKSLRSIKSHFSHKTIPSNSSYNSTNNLSESESNEEIYHTLCENYKGKNFENNVAKFKEEISNFCDVEENDESDLNQKVLNLLTPQKKFIHPLTLAASKMKFSSFTDTH